jgi:hypothetical protein
VRIVRFALVVVLSIPFPVRSAAQQTATSNVSTKDPAALAVLVHMAAATGWNLNSTPTDAVVTGKIDRASTNERLNFTYKVRGRTQLRSDLQGTLSTTFVINNGEGAISHSDGSSRYIDPQEAFSVWPVLLPFFSSWPTAGSDPSMNVSYLGEEAVNSVPCSKIQIALLVDSAGPLRTVKQLTGEITLWVDTATGLPAQVQYTRTASGNSTASVVFIRQFSNFQQVSGLLIPFTQQEFIGSTLIATQTIGSVTFNVGLTDADFALPVMRAEGL